MRVAGKLLPGLLALLLCGCFMESLEEQAKSKPGEESILKKTTQEVGLYDPEAGLVVSDAKVQATNPITGPLEAYGPMVEQIVQLRIGPAITMFEVQHERYPTYREFMDQIIREQNIQLPVLPAESRYQYDEENHKLVVVERPEDGWPKDDTPPAEGNPAAGATAPADTAPAAGGNPGAAGALERLQQATGAPALPSTNP